MRVGQGLTLEDTSMVIVTAVHTDLHGKRWFEVAPKAGGDGDPRSIKSDTVAGVWVYLR